LPEALLNAWFSAAWVATRHDKLVANYLAFIQLASIRLWLRVNESTAY
jgi:transposase